MGNNNISNLIAQHSPTFSAVQTSRCGKGWFCVSGGEAYMHSSISISGGISARTRANGVHAHALARCSCKWSATRTFAHCLCKWGCKCALTHQFCSPVPNNSSSGNGPRPRVWGPVIAHNQCYLLYRCENTVQAFTK